MKRIYIKETIRKIGEEVWLKGWVDNRRDHGKLVFIDLRDMTGIAQVVFLPNNSSAYEKVKDLRGEWVVAIKGKVNERPDNMKNSDLETGTVEIEALDLEVINQSKTPHISIEGDGYEIGEESRMKYRYLDLRRKRLQKNIRARHRIVQSLRNYLSDQDFIEIETPILTKSTPEGARDFIVPSRTQNGKFYALPQSPQQYKQLLMAGGMERYFQIARCFRDEDSRGDRQPEFTQLDLEMSFVETEEDVMKTIEEMVINLVENLYPEKKIQEIPFPRISYQEAMDKYGIDRPDLRKDKNDPNLLAFCWVIDFPFFEKTDEGKWTFTHNPFSSPQKKFMDDLLNKKNIENILAAQYDIALNGYEIGGGSIRNHTSKALRSVFEIMDYESERIDNNFGHMMEAFDLGTPSHGGIAFGLERLVMILENEPNIREVTAFPKTGDGRDPMMDSPAEVSKEQLEELGIEVKKEE